MRERVEASNSHNSIGLVIALSMSQFMGWGLLYNSFSVFIEPMAKELGWSYSEITGALTLGLLVQGLAAVGVGRWIDAHGGRSVMFAGSLLGALSLYIWSRTSSLELFYCSWVASGIAQAASLGDPAFIVLSANTPNARRSITTMTLASGLSSSVFIPIASFLTHKFGWRECLLIFAIFQVLGPSLLNLIALRGTKGSESAHHDDIFREHGKFLKLHKNTRFILIALCFGGHAFMFSGITAHLIPLGVSYGFTGAEMVLVASIAGVSQVAGRVALIGFASISSIKLGKVILGVIPVGLLVLAASTKFDHSLIYLFAIIYGSSNGLATIIKATCISEVISKQQYGRVMGVLNVIVTIPRMIAPVLFSLSLAITQSYSIIIWITFVVVVVGWISFCMVRPVSSSPAELSYLPPTLKR